jgi:hypothetical protein
VLYREGRARRIRELHESDDGADVAAATAWLAAAVVVLAATDHKRV